MANLENNSLDTRTFAQICEGLSKKEWVELQSELMQKLKRSAQCIYKWRKGQCIPLSIMERLHISNHVNKKFNVYTRYWTLFPEES